MGNLHSLIQHQDEPHTISESVATLPASPIDSLPEELLIEVFTMVVWHAPFAVARLLIVCKYWLRVIQMVPSLWSRILVMPKSARDFLKLAQYVEIAVANSGSLPLDVTITIQHIVFAQHPSEPAEVTQQAIGAYLPRILKGLVGVNGATMARWRILEINTEDRYFGHYTGFSGFFSFMTELKYPTPILESLSLRVDSVDMHFPRIGGPLQDLRSLKSLTVDSGGRLGHIKFVPETIQSLCFRLWGTTRVLSPFTHLRNLGIMLWPNSNVTYKNDPALIFPFLECLSLELRRRPKDQADCSAMLPHKIEAPSLKRLRLFDEAAIQSIVRTNSFRHIRILDLLAVHTNSTLQVFKSYVQGCHSLTSLTIYPWNFDVVTKELNQLKKRGQLPPQLKYLDIVISDNEGTVLTTMNASDVLGPWGLPGEYNHRTHQLWV